MDIEPPVPELKCSVCLLTVQEAVGCPFPHLICEACARDDKCPVCRQSPLTPNSLARLIVRNLPVQCTFCLETTTVGDFDTHMNKYHPRCAFCLGVLELLEDNHVCDLELLSCFLCGNLHARKEGEYCMHEAQNILDSNNWSSACLLTPLENSYGGPIVHRPPMLYYLMTTFRGGATHVPPCVTEDRENVYTGQAGTVDIYREYSHVSSPYGEVRSSRGVPMQENGLSYLCLEVSVRESGSYPLFAEFALRTHGNLAQNVGFFTAGLLAIGCDYPHLLYPADLEHVKRPLPRIDFASYLTPTEALAAIADYHPEDRITCTAACRNVEEQDFLIYAAALTISSPLNETSERVSYALLTTSRNNESGVVSGARHILPAAVHTAAFIGEALYLWGGDRIFICHSFHAPPIEISNVPSFRESPELTSQNRIYAQDGNICFRREGYLGTDVWVLRSPTLRSWPICMRDGAVYSPAQKILLVPTINGTRKITAFPCTSLAFSAADGMVVVEENGVGSVWEEA